VNKSPAEGVPLRAQVAIWGAALFNFSMTAMASTVVPLWVAQLTGSATMMGIALGARHFLTLVLSIHGGVLMDRLGTRRVMIGFAAAGTIVPLLYPAWPTVWLVIGLQMIAGLAEAMGWIGAQALSGRVMKGDPVFIGRMTAIVRLGGFLSPVIAGLAWDYLGAWGAFVAMGLWGGGGFVAVLMLPAPRSAEAAGRQRTPVRPGDLMPRVGDYVDAFRLAAIPAVILVLIATMVRLGGTGVQGSFYVIYVEGLGITATEIGVLLGVSSLCASVGSLFAGKVASHAPIPWLVVGAVSLSALAITVTPLLGGIYAVLLLVLALRGLFLGISQPLEISIFSRALDYRQQGQGVGLRSTVNRIAQSLMPIAMGLVAELAGIEHGFFVIGGLLMAGMAGAAVFAYRHPELARVGG